MATTDLYDAEYVAVYQPRDDGDWDLYMVLSRNAIEDDPQQLDVLEEDFKLEPNDTLDFPDVWSDK
jgi:hypothetical protein